MGFDSFIKFLNEHAGVLSSLFSLVVAVSTVFYVILTRSLVKETKKLRKAQMEPMISIYLEPREEYLNWIELVVENIGAGPAFEVRFELKDDMKCFGNKDLSSFGFAKNGIRYLGANQCYRIFIADMTDDFNGKLQIKIPIRVIYKGTEKREIVRDYVLDFSQFEGLNQLGIPPLHQIADSLKIIADDFSVAKLIGFANSNAISEAELEKVSMLINRSNKSPRNASSEQ